MLTPSQKARLQRLVDYVRYHPGAHKKYIYRNTGVAWDEFGEDIITVGNEDDCYLDEKVLKEFRKKERLDKG